MEVSVKPIHKTSADLLHVEVFHNRDQMGRAAGQAAAEKIRQMLTVKSGIRVIFASAPSQKEFLQTLKEETDLDWSRITVFHMDEYIGLSTDAPQSFSKFLSNSIFNEVKPGKFHVIDGLGNVEDVCRHYGQLILDEPIDLVFLGIGENGHIAFNDPPVANFLDRDVIKVVKLDEICRQQQVNDGCFQGINEVPTYAFSLTIPTIMSGAHLFCMVPGARKREAVSRTIYGSISEECPASILRTHRDCNLYLDEDSYGE